MWGRLRAPPWHEGCCRRGRIWEPFTCGDAKRRLGYAITLPLFLALSLSTAAPAAAQYALVSNRAAIGGAGLIDWGTIPTGPQGNPFAVSVTGTSLTASVSSGSALIRIAEGAGWIGNFTAGDPLLLSLSPSLDIAFSSDVAAVGAQYQPSFMGLFSGSIEAFDAMGNSLALFNFGGNSSNAQDGSAVFAGISSATGGIRRVRFNNGSASFALNNVSVNPVAGSPPAGLISVAPEPDTILLMATGFLALLALRRRRAR